MKLTPAQYHVYHALKNGAKIKQYGMFRTINGKETFENVDRKTIDSLVNKGLIRLRGGLYTADVRMSLDKVGELFGRSQSYVSNVKNGNIIDTQIREYLVENGYEVKEVKW